jgi:hypothetical protein
LEFSDSSIFSIVEVSNKATNMHNIPKVILELRDVVLISKKGHSPVNDDESV